jgi:hypothetical protein
MILSSPTCCPLTTLMKYIPGAEALQCLRYEFVALLIILFVGWFLPLDQRHQPQLWHPDRSHLTKDL